MTTADHNLTDLVDAALDRLARLVPGWEERAGQREMAHRWAGVLDRGGVLVAEAPTGIGKSLAYLLPSLLNRLRGSGPVVVSTHTKALQDQLLTRDAPLAFRAVGGSLRAVALKGRANYLCRRRAEVRLSQGELFSAAGFSDRDLTRLRAWAETTRSGELEELEALGVSVPAALWSEIASDALVCGDAKCDAQSGCFAKRARREAARADLVLVNHALLLSDPGLRASLVAEAGALVLDEAHHVERVAREQLGVSLGLADVTRLAGRTDGRTGVLRLLKRALRRGRAGGALGERFAEAERAIGSVIARARDLARDLEPLLPPGVLASRLPKDLDWARVSPSALDQLLAAIGALRATLEAIERDAEREPHALKPEAGDALDELRARGAAWTEVEQALRATIRLEERGTAFYVDRDERGAPRLNRRPVRVGDQVRATLLTLCPRVAIASATLRSGEDFGPLFSSLGLNADETEAIALPSPFDLGRRVFCAVLNGSEPGDPAFAEEAAQAVLGLALSLRRNTLVLLTSYQMLAAVRARLEPRLAQAGIALLAQEPGEPAAALADAFREGGAAVLLGTASFWEGMDFPGSALEVLVIARLPFAVPTDPVLEARSEVVAAEGGDPFRDLMLPEAVLRFRQGLGRLIRTASDRGAAIVLDPRAVRASYRARFLSVLPAPPLVTDSAPALVEAASAWFSEEVSPCPA